MVVVIVTDENEINFREVRYLAWGSHGSFLSNVVNDPVGKYRIN
jgi:hypothetical protein